MSTKFIWSHDKGRCVNASRIKEFTITEFPAGKWKVAAWLSQADCITVVKDLSSEVEAQDYLARLISSK